MDKRTFITAQAIIVAGLLAWAQLWTHTYDIYHDLHRPIWCVSLFLAITYAAVFFSMLSIVLAALSRWSNQKVDLQSKLAVGSASFSAVAMLTLVGTSLFSVWLKAVLGWREWEPLWTCNCPCAASGVTVASTAVGLAVLAGCMVLSWRWLAATLVDGEAQPSGPKGVKNGGDSSKGSDEDRQGGS